MLVARRVDGLIVTGRQAAVVLAAQNPDLDGVFCGSDQVAAG